MLRPRLLAIARKTSAATRRSVTPSTLSRRLATGARPQELQRGQAEKRAKKEIGSSLEASLEIKINKQLYNISQNTDFAELCITSFAKIFEHEEESIKVNTTKAKGSKCPVCWKIQESKCSRHSA